MDLTTAARVRERLGLSLADQTATTLLSSFISRVSAAAERLMNRNAESTSRATQFDVAYGQREFWLPGFPISSVASIYNDSDRAFGAETLIASTDYYTEAATGLLAIETGLVVGRGVLKVTYTGGMAASATAFVSAYPDIADAIDEQVAFLWQRRHSVGLTSVGEAAGSIATVDLRAWLPNVRTVLLSHRRMAFV